MKLAHVLAGLVAASSIASAQPTPPPAPGGAATSPREAFLTQRVIDELAADGIVLARRDVALALAPEGDALVVELRDRATGRVRASTRLAQVPSDREAAVATVTQVVATLTAQLDAGPPPHGPARAAPPVDAHAPVDAGPPALVERWRRARLLRAQGQAAAAAAACLDIADAADPTWSPIALVEAIRIDLDALSAPEAALAVADRMLAAWPAHPLAADARVLRCRALRQLGRAAECAPPPP